MSQSSPCLRATSRAHGDLFLPRTPYPTPSTPSLSAGISSPLGSSVLVRGRLGSPVGRAHWGLAGRVCHARLRLQRQPVRVRKLSAVDDLTHVHGDLSGRRGGRDLPHGRCGPASWGTQSGLTGDAVQPQGDAVRPQGGHGLASWGHGPALGGRSPVSGGRGLASERWSELCEASPGCSGSQQELEGGPAAC